MNLSPSQQEAYDHLKEAFPIGSIFVVWSPNGFGKTTMLKEFHREFGGEVVQLRQYIDAMRTQDPFRMEETLESVLMEALRRSDLVIVDDIDYIYDVICGCGYMDPYPRRGFVHATFAVVLDFAIANGKKIVLGSEGKVSTPVKSRAYYAGFQKLEVEDYAFIVNEILGEKSGQLDFKRIYRFAPKLNAHQLRSVCEWYRDKECDTEIFIEYLRSQRMASNVDLGEVEPVDLRSLRGVDDVIEALEANIIMPLERDDLATEFGIRPKRGVLLAGPPGTGKTTVGRALAHRLRSKFFLIDGTFIAGSDDFYRKISRVFEAAKNNAPAIIFIDDSDVIFEDDEDFGLYRFLLTMLDGLEGESNKRICVMMTTMDVASVPPALVRSGRIELWLETRLPDQQARMQILEDFVHTLPGDVRPRSLERLAEITDGLTGADLRRLVEDGKILYAFDKARNIKLKDIDGYYEQAVLTIRNNKEKYADAEKRAIARKSAGDGTAHGFAFVRAMAARMSSSSDD